MYKRTPGKVQSIWLYGDNAGAANKGLGQIATCCHAAVAAAGKRTGMIPAVSRQAAGVESFSEIFVHKGFVS